MNANHPREALSAYLDGELGEQERARLEEHLHHCAECTALLADLELLARAGAEEQVPPAPAEMRARIMAHVPRGVTERRRHWIHRMPLAAAASLAAAAVLWLVFQSAPPPSPDPDFGLDIDPRRAPSPALEEQQAPEGGVGSAAEAKEAFRQESKRSELNEPAPLPAQTTEQRFAYESSGDGEAVTDKKKEDAPAAAPLPEVRRPRPVDRSDRAQQEKQRSAGRLEPIPPPADSSRERDLALEAASEGMREAAKVAALTAAATAPDSVASQSAPMAKSAVAADMDSLPASPPTLVLREAGQEIRLTESGLLTVHASQYDCTILVLPGTDDAESTAGARSLLGPLTDARGQPVDEEFLALFQEGFVNEESAVRKQSVRRAQAGGATGPQEVPAWTVLLERAGGADLLESNGRAAAIRSRLQSLVRERYRSRLEAQCGPLPQPAEETDQKP